MFDPSYNPCRTPAHRRRERAGVIALLAVIGTAIAVWLLREPEDGCHERDHRDEPYQQI